MSAAGSRAQMREREKERMGRTQRSHNASNVASAAAASSSAGGSRNAAAAAVPLSSPSPSSSSSVPSASPPPRVSDDDIDPDSDVDAEDAAANKREYINRVVQMWKDKAKKPQRTGGPLRFKTTFRNTILDVFRERGWKESESEVEWDIFWTNKEWIRLIYDKIHLEQHQRVNHFRNFYELTRKDLLIKNLKRAKRLLSKNKGHTDEDGSGGSVHGAATHASHYDFFPDTYSLPAEYSLFVEAFKKAPGSSWIMKPIGSSQGKGIFLFEKLHQISEWKSGYQYRANVATSGGGGGGSGANSNTQQADEEKAEKYIVQRYLSDPLLIGGKKFDLRIYCLVTNFNPLTCYMYREGFARFSSTRFTMVKGDLDNAYVHLTNVAIQKKGDDYDAESGGKWDVRSLKLYLMDRFGRERVNNLFVAIQLICIRSLLSVQKVIINDKNSFELYGYDILIDASLKPWLIEVNASPSLTANTPKDYQLKLALLHDTMNVVDMERRLTGNEEQIGGFDLIYRGGFVKFNSNCTFTATLGFHNNRTKQLKKMWKNIRRKKQQEQTTTTGGTTAGGTNATTATGSGASAGGSQSSSDKS